MAGATDGDALQTGRATTRRSMLGAVGALALVGPAAAQPRIHRLAYLAGGTSSASAQPQRALFGRLEELGYREGRNLVIERRFGDGHLDRLPGLATALVALKPDVLFASSSQATLAAIKATSTIPVVFAAVTDPEGLGVVKSLRQPGTNATGVANQGDELQVKLLQLLREVFPAASVVAVLYNPLNASEVRILAALKPAAATLGLRLRPIEVSSPSGFEPAYQRLKTERPDALYVLAGPLMFGQRDRIVALTNALRLPAVYGLRELVEAGGLMAYSFDLVDQFRMAAAVIARVLRGESPSTIPVEQPTRFELILNQRTAQAQGVKFPQAVLLRADRVIE